MKEWVQEKLICPECLKEEVPLELCIDAAEEDDVLEGNLTCPACQRTYPIQNGVAVVLPAASSARMPSGMTSLPIPSPGMIAIFIEDMLVTPPVLNTLERLIGLSVRPSSPRSAKKTPLLFPSTKSGIDRQSFQ